MFLIDQGIGVHHAQVESLGYGWSWVSGEAVVDHPDYGSLQFSCLPHNMTFHCEPHNMQFSAPQQPPGES